MDEGKPEHPESQGPAEESQPADNGLVSKLARAYSSLPPEQRWATTLPGSGDPVSNPELEDRFQQLLKELEVPGTSQGQGDHKPDPRAIALLEKKIKELQAQGGNLSDDGASAETALADKVASVGRGTKQCGKCGHVNSASTRFCGMCGAELTKSGSVDGKGAAPAANAAPAQREPKAPFLIERGAESRSRWGFRIGLLVLLLAVLALLVSQQWPAWRQRLLTTWTARGSNAQPATPAPATTAPAPNERPANPPVSVQAPEPAPAASKPSPEARKTLPKPAPPTIVKRPLPGPVPLTAALPELARDTPDSAAQPDQGAPATAPEPSQSPPQRTRVSQGVAQAGLIFKVDPEYPPVARTARIQGSVVLHAIIGTDGTVQQLQVVSGNPLLASPALNAVKNWRYRPYLVDGQPVEVETTVTVNFKGE
ncbi:MAG TPA: TonB family protein [Terriglobales bacterium]|nr:TonB family protein [Terriglobales bacterium]